MIIDEVCPFALQTKECAEDDDGDEKGDESNANKAPEVGQSLLEQSSEPCWGVSQITEEGSWYEQEVNEEIEKDGGVSEGDTGVSHGTFVEVKEDFSDRTEVEAA